MMGPPWIPGTFAGVMLVVAVVSAARLAADAAARRWLAADADADVAHLLMAISMAGMLVTSLRTLPAGVWEPVFGLLTAWFAGRVAVDARGQGARGWVANCHAPHLVHSVAMLYMFLALRTAPGGGAGTAGMSGAASGQTLALPTLALVLALLLAGYTVRDVDRLTAPAAGWLTQPTRAGAGTALAAGPAASAGVAATSSWPPFIMKNMAGRPPTAARAGTAAATAVWVPACCRIAMGVTMAYMLVVMI
jgi:Domain of unknown function (DUF5134)